MNNIKLIRTKHLKYCVDLLSKEWDLGKKVSESKGNICAWIYMLDILERSDKLIVYIEDNKIIGFSSYGSYKYPRKKN